MCSVMPLPLSCCCQISECLLVATETVEAVHKKCIVTLQELEDLQASHLGRRCIIAPGQVNKRGVATSLRQGRELRVSCLMVSQHTDVPDTLDSVRLFIHGGTSLSVFD